MSDYRSTLSEYFNGKTVLVTGNTGFKGSWLTAWLLRLKAHVVGLSLDVPTMPAHFTATNMENRIHQRWGDVQDRHVVEAAVRDHRPDVVFHCAAQPLVRRSYAEPWNTFQTNVGGTLNVLEALRRSKHACTAVMITSDKCYENVEQVWGYRENDRLGGKDPYSGSKGAAELVIKSYTESFFRNGQSNVRVAIGRAGNVIGGADWAEDRIVPDTVRAWARNEAVRIRNPRATRPWQHVLEPLSGYLNLAQTLSSRPDVNGEPFNFGPAADHDESVSELLEELRRHWAGAKWISADADEKLYEAGLLKLSCEKAWRELGWRSTLSFAETVSMTAAWYQMFYADGGSSSDAVWAFTEKQIGQYEDLARKRSIKWAL